MEQGWDPPSLPVGALPALPTCPGKCGALQGALDGLWMCQAQLWGRRRGGGVSGCFFGVFQAPGEPRVVKCQGGTAGQIPRVEGAGQVRGAASVVPAVRAGSSGLPWAEGFGFPWLLRNLLVGKEQLQQQEGLFRGWKGGGFSHQEFQGQ